MPSPSAPSAPAVPPAPDPAFPGAGRTATPEPLPPRRSVTFLLALGTLAWVLAFSPEPQVLATIPGLLGWFAVIERSRRMREVLLWLVLFGTGATVLGYRWLAPTIQVFGGLDPVLSWVLAALFGVLGTVHGAIFALFWRGLLRRGRRPHPLLTAILFAGAEALPVRLFAWSVGHGAVDVPPLLQAAEWGGVPGVSLAVLLLVVPAYEALRAAVVRDGPVARPRAVVGTFALGVLVFAFGAWRHHQVREEERSAARHLRVAIVQADVGSTDKREAERDGGKRRLASIAAYRRGSERAAAEGADLVVWPETAITDAVPFQDAQQTNEYLKGLSYGFLVDLGGERAFLVGAYEQVAGRRSLASGERLKTRYNVAALRQPGDAQAPWSRYRKVYLIPFGETMPFGIFEDRLPQNFRMEAGELPQDLLRLEHLGITFAPFLCYEGILADHVRACATPRRPDVLVSLANDSWFGDSWEPAQHLNFTRFRAVEHRAPLVRATNTGISAFVSAAGEVEGRLGVGVEDVLVREVPIVDRAPTLYARLGWRLPEALWVLALAGWLLAMLRPPPVVR